MTSQAVVLGASISGLLAARVLADHFADVTIVDRDRLPIETYTRRGIPQGVHANNLLARGLAIVERSFPGFTEELREAGASIVDAAAGGRARILGVPVCRVTVDALGAFVRRPVLEAVLRRRVAALPNVRIVEGCRAIGFACERGTVTALRLEDGLLPAALVVDASGRGSRTPEWLDELGYAPPIEERIEVDVTYTTREFRRQATDRGGDRFALVGPLPPGRRGGFAEVVDPDAWLVTLFAYAGDKPPRELDAFRAFARSLPRPDIGEIVDADPLGDAATMKFPANVRRRYDLLPRFPEGLLVFGDALVSLNPSYATGMTNAAIQAEVLGQVLASSSSPLARHFFRGAARALDDGWEMIVGGDLAIPGVRGHRSLARRLRRKFFTRVVAAAEHDPLVARALVRVANLQARPTTLLHPKLLLRIFSPR